MSEIKDISSKVTGLWWEGEDCHVTTEDGQHTVYKGAWVRSMRCSKMSGGPELDMVVGGLEVEVKDDPVPPVLDLAELNKSMKYLEELSGIIDKFRK